MEEKIMKKILATVLALVMMLSCAVFASAAETTLPDITFEGWWTAWTQGLEITEEGFTMTFDVKSENATANYHSPTLIVHAGTADTLGTEYWAQRSDAWGWLYAENVGDHAAALQEKGYSWEYTFAEGFDWANFVPTLIAGTSATVTAKLEGTNVLLTYAMAGVTNKVTIPVNAEAPVYVCITGENCAVSNIVVTTPDAPAPEAPIADGDQFHIYYPAGESYITATANDTGKKLLDGTKEEAALWTVEVDENGYYTFLCDGKYLTSGETGNSLTLADAASDYSLWTLEAAENGWFIKSVNAAYNGKNQYLEYYSGFTTYGFNATNASVYTFQFEAVEIEDVPAPNPGTGDAIFAVLAIFAASGMGLTAVASKKK